MATVRNTILSVQGKQIPAKIYREKRNNVRASVGKKSVILRMPSWMDGEDRLKQMDWFRDWIEETFQKSPDLFKYCKLIVEIAAYVSVFDGLLYKSALVCLIYMYILLGIEFNWILFDVALVDTPAATRPILVTYF